VQSAPGYGRIGITFCPGKYQPDAATGVWHRDLNIDLNAIDSELAASESFELGGWRPTLKTHGRIRQCSKRH
jgi:ADP-ribosyl-[dinitrogen reductase] hydrolase